MAQCPHFFLTGGFHADVVIDWISFLFLPSLFFTLLRAFGTPRRLAWDWMWLLPSASLVAMQAGSIGNDLPGMAAILAALHCANRFVARRQTGYLLDALLAAGLCTGIKLSNLPLAAFVLIILLGNFKALTSRRLAFAAATAAALCVSAFIPMLLNLKHTGTILGVTTAVSDELHNPAAGLTGNSLISLEAALTPPVFPGANQVSAILQHSLGHKLMAWLHQNYPSFSLQVNELPQEEHGALGLAMTVAFLANIMLWVRFRHHVPVHQSTLLPWQKIAWWSWLAFALAVLFSKLGTRGGFPREMLPWYPLLLAPLIAFFGREQTARSPFWRWLAPLVSLSIVPALLLTPSRPLIPPKTVVKLAQKCGASAASLERLKTVYAVYASRADLFVGLKQYLPPDAKVLALVSDGEEPTASWWKPFGSRRCTFVLSEADVAAAQKQGAHYLVLNELSCQKYFHMDIPHWLETHHAREVKTVEIRLLAAEPPIRYTLAEFQTNDHQ